MEISLKAFPFTHCKGYPNHPQVTRIKSLFSNEIYQGENFETDQYMKN